MYIFFLVTSAAIIFLLLQQVWAVVSALDVPRTFVVPISEGQARFILLPTVRVYNKIERVLCGLYGETILLHCGPRIQDVLEIQMRCVGSYLGKIKGRCVQLTSSCCVYTKIFYTLLTLFCM